MNCSSEPPNGYIIHNANIYTSDNDLPKIESFVVMNGRFIDIGNKIDLMKKWKIFKSIDLKGLTILPGLIDAHGHLQYLGDSLLSVNLIGSKSVEEIRERIREYIGSHPRIDPTTEWIVGWGWDQTLWTSKSFPTCNDIDCDPFLKKFSISLSRIDGHVMLVNKNILVKIEEKTVDGGEIGKDKETGELTGIFVDNAMQLITKIMPSPSEQTLLQQLRLAIYRMHSFGLIGVHDASVSLDKLKFYKRIINEQSEDFNIRYYAMVEVPNNNYIDGIEIVEGLGDGRLTVRSVKLFMDGALGSWGAAMLEPYSDDQTKHGLLLSDPTLLPSEIRKWMDKGIQVNTHCIGDKANHVVINAYEAAFKDYVLSQNVDKELSEQEIDEEVKKIAEKVRFRIEHAQILTLKDIKRVSRLNIIPSMQPTHAISDMKYAEQRLGSERIKGAYAWRSFIEAGVKAFPLSSDFPVEHVNPFLGFHAAISRKDVDGNSPHGKDGWFPSQKLTRQEALKGFTIDAAYAGFSENVMGSITIGKYADFVVIDRDIMEVPEMQIVDTKVLATIFGGKVVFGDLKI
ncbi:13015_t:CDS:10 [Funneliformis caledonium]|uniref:13015_t:CDS:1 n=1 Tax=Funneliformis caledonium TaxID=1117310 RepID=A0A9N8ZDG0_9GLOM|nr:13015_t:CDS:10 [Funneliformis caledonium]